jgi:hypothetical protein
MLRVEEDIDEDEEVKKKRDKNKMMEMMVELDFAGEVSLKKMLTLPYEIDGGDELLALTP